MNFEEHTTKIAMMRSACGRLSASATRTQATSHPARRLQRTCDLEHDAGLIAALVGRGNVVGRFLVAAAMPFILRAVAQEIAVQLPDTVFGEGC